MKNLLKEYTLFEIEQKIAALCESYANKRITRVQFDDNYKMLTRKRDLIASKK